MTIDCIVGLGDCQSLMFFVSPPIIMPLPIKLHLSVCYLHNVYKLCCISGSVLPIKMNTTISITKSLLKSTSRSFGTRGARGHGWLQKYRAGLGGRHLQGRFHNRDLPNRVAINNQVFDLNNSSSSIGNGTEKKIAYLDIQVEDQKEINRITIELASAALPITCENFVKLCVDGLYANSKVFKIEPKVGICLGDTTEKNDGSQGSCHESVAKDAGSLHTFRHESTVLSHAEKGMVSMLSTGLDRNDSRFMITTVEDAPHLDGRYVAFGRVKEGMDILEALVKNTFTKKGRPTLNIEVVKSGVL
jgi:cyclophilin family peptidyl-prolyl cis-trans isomerase